MIGQELDGFIIVDKPLRITSREVSVIVKRLARVSKAGHIGTLDPNVSGVLPVAVGRSRKLIRYVIGQEKEYVGVVRFDKAPKEEDVVNAFSRLTGIVEQVPPKESAVAKRKRKRRVFCFQLLELVGKKALFRTIVQAGTYIRVLCKDVGRLLGINAVMDELRRIRVGNIDESMAHNLHHITFAFHLFFDKHDGTALKRILLPPDALLTRYKKVIIRKSAAENLMRGAWLMRPGILESDNFKKGEVVRIYSNNLFVGMGRAMVDWKDVKDKKRGLVVKSERIHLRSCDLL
jgi:predicted rRNA pseudouridine synthase